MTTWTIRARLAAALGLAFLLQAAAPAALGAQSVYRENRIPANGVQIEYRVRIDAPLRRLYEVQVEVRGIREEVVELAMPAWAPGAYRIENFARNVQGFQAETRSGGRALAWRKTDKQTWEIRKAPADDVRVTYHVYSDRLTPEMADLDGPATYMYVAGHKHVPVSVRFEAPRSWNVHTGLARRGGVYEAPDYDMFIDAPVFIGQFLVLEFSSSGVNYELVFSEREVELSREQVIDDIRDLTDRTIEMFGGAPFDRYVFLFRLLPTPGTGGLEHLNSTRITVGRNDFSSGERYERFLNVVAHEFFHAWNVKRIRPDVLGPFDYTREVYTPLLWMAEGLTSYYARLMMLRAGILNAPEYLARLGAEINLLQQNPGRLLMSLEEASWNAWLRADDEDSVVSYYRKGEIASALLDVEIRVRSGNQQSLDDVLRHLQTHYADQGVGFPEDGFLEALHVVTGLDFEETYTELIRSRGELDYTRYLRQVGLRTTIERQPSTIYMGVAFEPDTERRPRISRVTPSSPAERAGLRAGDAILALDGRRIDVDTFLPEFQRQRVGAGIEVTVARDEQLLRLNLVPGETQQQRWLIEESPGATPDQLELRRGWLEE